MKRIETILIFALCAVIILSGIAWSNRTQELEAALDEMQQRMDELEQKIERQESEPEASAVAYVAHEQEPYIPVFPLSDADRDLIERVVMAESGNQPVDGQIAVASCIYNTAVDKGMNPADVVQVKGQYASPYQGEVTDSIKQAVSVVFDEDKPMEDVKYFYSTAGGFVSAWHENALEHVATIADHKFFGVE